MRKTGLGILLLAALILVLPFAAAQDEAKKDPEKKDLVKKDEAKKDEAKKDDAKKGEEKKDEPSKDDAKKPKETAKKEEKLTYGMTVTAPIARFDSENAGILYILVPQFDQEKLANHQQQMFQAQGNPQRMIQLQQDLIRMKLTGGFMTPKDFEIRIGEKCRFRTLIPPTVFDDKGNLKRLSQKELTALRGKAGLPGYQTEQDTLKPGQLVTIYLAKEPKAPKTTTRPSAGKKKKVDDDFEMAEKKAPEAVMIVIQREAANR